MLIKNYQVSFKSVTNYLLAWMTSAQTNALEYEKYY